MSDTQLAQSRYTNLNQATVKRAVSQLVSLGLVDRRLVLGEDGRYRKFLTVV